jgi:beta-mannosidase
VALVAGLQPVGLAAAVGPALAWRPASYAALGARRRWYAATAAYEPDAGGEAAVEALRVGFRTVELVQDPLPGGSSYFFRVNGRKTLMRGSNFVPVDAFESRVTAANLTAHF